MLALGSKGLCMYSQEGRGVCVCVSAGMTEAEAGSQRSPEPQRSQNKQMQFYTGHLRLLAALAHSHCHSCFPSSAFVLTNVPVCFSGPRSLHRLLELVFVMGL